MLTSATVFKRSWAIRSAALLLGAALMSTANAAEKVKVRLDYLPYGLHAPFYYAQEKGLFAQRGLEVEIDDGNGGGPALALVSAQKYDIGYLVLGSMVLARDKGMPVKAIAGLARKGDFGLVFDPSRGIESPRDLEGKTVLYSANSFETPFIDVYLKKVGVDKSKVNLTNVDLAAKVSSYMSGKADAMLTTVPLYTMKGMSPRESKGMLYSDAGINVPSFGLVAHEETIAKRPKVLSDFVAAYQQSWLAIYRNGEIDAAVAALLKHRPNAKLDPKLMRAQIESFYPYFDTAASKGKPLLWMPPSDWASGVQILKDLQLIKPNIAAESVYTNQFVPQ